MYLESIDVHDIIFAGETNPFTQLGLYSKIQSSFKEIGKYYNYLTNLYPY